MNTKKVLKNAKPVAKKSISKMKASTPKKTVKVASKKVVRKSKTISAAKRNIEVKKTGYKKEPTIKRVLYMTLSVILGLLLGIFVHLFVELVYMKSIIDNDGILKLNFFLGSPSFLPAIFQPFFLLCGLIFGVWLGFWGWNLVYVQRRHRMYRKLA